MTCSNETLSLLSERMTKLRDTERTSIMGTKSKESYELSGMIFTLTALGISVDEMWEGATSKFILGIKED